MKIDAALVRSIFDYRSDGTLIWKINTGKKPLIGTVAGCWREDGYHRVGLYGHDYYVHHLVWAWHHGVWPQRLDHRNTDAGANWIDNLREATQSQNIANSRKQKRVHLKGASPSTRASTWRSQIMVDGKYIHLGNYPTQEQAHAAYVAAAQLHFQQFARAA